MDDSYWPEGAPRNAEYEMFTGDHDPDAAARRFEERYQQGPPAFVFWCPDACGVLRVGPVKDNQNIGGLK